ncbi:hypothetical protein WSM22_35890 [Cytophagales bacterium WSM2-2]|nr:hypothetical protein WSM22_35890 [Cytophagales bacterium WSM2-2]
MGVVYKGGLKEMQTSEAGLEEILRGTSIIASPLLDRLRQDKSRAIYLVSCLQNKYLFVDDSFREVTGYAPAELLNKGLEFWIPLIHPENKAGVMESIIEGHRLLLDPDYSVKELRPLNLVYKFKRKEGQWIWLQETKWIIPSHDNVKDFILGSLTDITAQRLNEDLGLLQTASNNSNGLLKAALKYKEANKKQLIDQSQVTEPARNKNIDLLTKREKEILKLISEGLSSKQVSDKLFISINTVETHRRHLLSKLKVKNSIELVKEASKAFWL